MLKCEQKLWILSFQEEITEVPAGYVAKLTDFDLSKFLDPDESSLMTTTVGTDAFKAPEFYQRDQQRKIHYHRNVDIYTLGLTYLAMVQENKNLVPQIETPGQDSELHEPIGRPIAERIKYGKEPLTVFPKSRRFKQAAK